MVDSSTNNSWYNQVVTNIFDGASINALSYAPHSFDFVANTALTYSVTAKFDTTDADLAAWDSPV